MRIPADVVRKVQATNQSNLKKISSGGTINYQYVSRFLVLGTHTDPAAKKYIDQMDDEPSYCTGKIEVLRHAIVGKGELKATRPKSELREFEDRLNEISKKKVFFA